MSPLRSLDRNSEMYWCVISVEYRGGWHVEWVNSKEAALKRLEEISDGEDAPEAYVCKAVRTNVVE